MATAWSELTEVALLAALRAPANIRAARAAVINFFMVKILRFPIAIGERF
jgi:hypothetical protein